MDGSVRINTNRSPDRHLGRPEAGVAWREMTIKFPKPKPHRHDEVTTYVLRQRAGVPYEVERKVCSSCEQVLGERPVRRAAA
jgi:hypothetical protein